MSKSIKSVRASKSATSVKSIAPITVRNITLGRDCVVNARFKVLPKRGMIRVTSRGQLPLFIAMPRAGHYAAGLGVTETDFCKSSDPAKTFAKAARAYWS
jgi:hypothetical protein